jgi:hypothetical protein
MYMCGGAAHAQLALRKFSKMLWQWWHNLGACLQSLLPTSQFLTSYDMHPFMLLLLLLHILPALQQLHRPWKVRP